MKELKDFYSDILEACRSCAEIGDEDDPISTGVGYEADGVSINLSYLASGQEHEDGYTNVKISVEEISGTIINDYGDEEDFSEVELNELSTYIENELPTLLEILEK